MAREDLKRIRAALDVELEALVESLQRSPHRAAELREVTDDLRRLIADPLDLNDEAIDALRPATAAARANESAWGRFKQAALELAIEYRQADLQQIEARRITTAAEVWKTRYKVIETEATGEAQRLQSYAEQVAYTFFLRLLLARILEDRGLLPRLTSDGGLALAGAPAVAVRPFPRRRDHGAASGRAAGDTLPQGGPLLPALLQPAGLRLVRAG